MEIQDQYIGLIWCALAMASEKSQASSMTANSRIFGQDPPNAVADGVVIVGK